MQRILGLVGLVIIFGGGFYYYSTYRKNIQDPVKQYEKISALDPKDQVAAFQKTISKWITDPVSQIPYPKGWKKVSVTVEKETFDVFTPDESNPPQYYFSTSFPKKIIKQVTIARCLNLDKKKITDWCVVGDNAQVNAYFKIITWVKEHVASNTTDLIDALSPKINTE